METYSVQLTEELSNRLSVDLIALPGRHSGRKPRALSVVVFGIKTAATLLRVKEARVVHVADVASWPLAWVASLRHKRSRVVLSAHGSDLSFAFRPGLRSTFYRLYLRAGAAALRKPRIIANSQYIFGLARRAGFADVHVVPLATDFSCDERFERRNVLYAGRISRAKGLRFIVEKVLPLLEATVRLRVAGTLWEERERSLLSHSRLDYLGPLSPAQLAGELGRAAVVLIPTRESEGFGLVAIEAAACGAFVISSRHTGLLDVVREPIGVVVDGDEVGAWAAAITSALAMTDEERQRRSDAARAEVNLRYRWSRVAKETIAIYELK